MGSMMLKMFLCGVAVGGRRFQPFDSFCLDSFTGIWRFFITPHTSKHVTALPMSLPMCCRRSSAPPALGAQWVDGYATKVQRRRRWHCRWSRGSGSISRCPASSAEHLDSNGVRGHRGAGSKKELLLDGGNHRRMGWGEVLKRNHPLQSSQMFPAKITVLR